jgi:hypothetical protein
MRSSFVRGTRGGPRVNVCGSAVAIVSERREEQGTVIAHCAETGAPMDEVFEIVVDDGEMVTRAKGHSKVKQLCVESLAEFRLFSRREETKSFTVRVPGRNVRLVPPEVAGIAVALGGQVDGEAWCVNVTATPQIGGELPYQFVISSNDAEVRVSGVVFAVSANEYVLEPFEVEAGAVDPTRVYEFPVLNACVKVESDRVRLVGFGEIDGKTRVTLRADGGIPGGPFVVWVEDTKGEFVAGRAEGRLMVKEVRQVDLPLLETIQGTPASATYPLDT